MDVTVGAGQRVKEFIQDQVLFERSDTALADDTQLLDGIIDSLALMQLVAYLEDEFDVEVDDSDITRDNFATVSHIQKMIEEKVAAA